MLKLSNRFRTIYSNLWQLWITYWCSTMCRNQTFCGKVKYVDEEILLQTKIQTLPIQLILWVRFQLIFNLQKQCKINKTFFCEI